MKMFVGLITILILITGCKSNNESAEVQDPNIVQVKNSEIEHVDRKTGTQISKRLVKLATSIPNVNDASAVVLGKYAIVGIDVDGNIERSQVGSIKYSVAESLKKDPYGANAAVIADPDITARLEEISEDIKAGKPMQGIMNELADIAGRLIPEVPADLINPSPSKGLEEPKNKLDEEEKNNLDKKQDRHSNYYKNN